MDKQHENPLGVEPINHLMARFAIPSIIAMLVSALYNMVDQFFIGHSVGMQGNAATNVAFPLTITCTAVSLLFGIGGAANFNLSMGRKKPEEAKHFIGNAIFLMLSFGIHTSKESYLLLNIVNINMKISCWMAYIRMEITSAFWSSFFWTRF